VALTRSEWVTLLLFLLALLFNVILLDENVQRALGLCGEGPVQTPCEEE
jgi:hypothetical protein